MNLDTAVLKIWLLCVNPVMFLTKKKKTVNSKLEPARRYSALDPCSSSVMDYTLYRSAHTFLNGIATGINLNHSNKLLIKY